MDDLEVLLARQAGVVSRRQLIEVGLAPHDVRRLQRRRDLVALARGVYLDHTGEPSWLQTAWGGVLALWPAALSHESALHAAGMGRVPGVRLHVAVDRDRSPTPPPGVRLHRLADLDLKVAWQSSPPRVRIEEAAVDVAAEARDDFAAIAVLADVVQSRRTTAARLQATLSARSKVARRRLLEGVIADIGAGTCSVLEHGYLARVERPHHLPPPERQRHERQEGSVYRDVAYPMFGRLIELDGRRFHDSATHRDDDLERDLDAALEGRTTIRLGWGQVFRTPCRTAAKVSRWLQAGGWMGEPRRCADCL
jgi:hypothetical protein